MHINHKFLLLLIIAFSPAVCAQVRLTQDPALSRELIQSGLLHSLLPVDDSRSFETAGLQKKILSRRPVSSANWSHSGLGSLHFSAAGSLQMTVPTSTGTRAIGPPDDPDYATYGHCRIQKDLHGENWQAFNRIAFAIYPDCEGAQVINLNFSFENAITPLAPSANRHSASHLIHLKNRQWNRCFLDLEEFQRDRVLSISFSCSIKGKDRTTGDRLVFYIDTIELQQIEAPAPVSGWMPAPNQIVYSTSGYESQGPKTAIVRPAAATTFRLLNATTGRTAFQAPLRTETTSLGIFNILDFSAFTRPGNYRLQCGETLTPPFPIGNSIWENSLWRVLNFIFGQRCGYPVPGKHAACHLDLCSEHLGQRISYAGGWHDAGDLSQQTLQTGDVTFALLELYKNQKGKNDFLAQRLLEEARWGLEFILRNRYGDGYRASSMGLLIWQDGIFGTLDDIHSVRVQNLAFDNFLYAAYEAYAALVIDNDPALVEYLTKTAQADYNFALAKHNESGFGGFLHLYEHSYGTSESQYQATRSWAASLLYQLTANPLYAAHAAEAIRYTLDCQYTAPPTPSDISFIANAKCSPAASPSDISFIANAKCPSPAPPRATLNSYLLTLNSFPPPPRATLNSFSAPPRATLNSYLLTLNSFQPRLAPLFTFNFSLLTPSVPPGFFYRDRSRRSIVHNIHQSREQVYMQALTLLCETQPTHPDRPQWLKSIHLYASYLKSLMPHTAPYGMIPSGIYHIDEHLDDNSFRHLHLFPPADAADLYIEQVRQGIPLDSAHYLRRFPVWFGIFNGNTAVHLSLGKSAALLGRFLQDDELLQIGRQQMEWTVGKNPFSQSLIYGEGNNYPQMDSFSSGPFTGSMPVGIRSLGNADVPYWPQVTAACYKEVWVTSAGKWLSLHAEY
jgi:hypothetical protein